MSLWSDLTGIVSNVIGDVGDFFKPAVEAVSSFDLPDVSIPDVGGLFSSAPDLSKYMNDSALLVKDVGAPYPMTQAASMFSDLNLGGLGNFVNNYGGMLYPLAKSGILGYMQGKESDKYMQQFAPLRQLSAEQQELYRRLRDPQYVRRAEARERKRMSEEVLPFLERGAARNRMLSRAKGTPYGASSLGNYRQGQADRYAMDIYGDIERKARENVAKNTASQLDLLTGQYRALAGAPQYQPAYMSASTYNPYRGALRALLS